MRRGRLKAVLPSSWDEMSETEKDTYYAYRSVGLDLEAVKVALLYTNLHVTQHRNTPDPLLVYFPELGGSLDTEALSYAISYFDFLDNPPQIPPILTSIGGAKGMNPQLQGAPFGKYLELQQGWQSLLHTQGQNEAQTQTQLHGLLKILYLGLKAEDIRPRHELMVAEWMQGLNAYFAQKWPFLFMRQSTETAPPPDIEAIINAQIRALTGGDVTKEKEILNIDTWRALTELNEKAREAYEMRCEMEKRNSF